MSDAATWVAAISPVTGLLGVLGGYWLAGHNDEARDKRAAQREDASRRAALNERLDDQKHEIQRQTLFDLQDQLRLLARGTAQIFAFDEDANSGGLTDDAVKIPDDLDNEFYDAVREIQRLRTRVLDDQLRQAVGDFVTFCSSNVLSSDVDKHRVLALNVKYPKLTDQLGEHLRRELDRMGTS